jgi:hypothetical protein
MQIQHGDVLIESIKELPKGVKVKSQERCVVAEGETTGHHHIIEAKGATLYELKGGDLYLELAAPATITHEEHKPLEIPEGIYHIGRVQEHDYLEDMARRVID